MITVLARPMPAIVSWQPLARVMAAGMVFVLVGSRSGTAARVTIAGAGVAAATAFLLDDPAAETLSASPTPLPARRAQRVAIAAVAVALWWAAAVTVAATQIGVVPLAGPALEVGVLVAVAVAVSAAAATMGDRTGGGIAGAAVSVACFASTFLPSRWWLPFPPDPAAPGATPRWLAVFVCATALLAWTSRDPARPRRLRKRR
jgi:hypothetical protein